MRNEINIGLAFVALFCAAVFQARAGELETVPATVAAPMVFYDEGGNVLPDGEYAVTARIVDGESGALYEEEQNVSVVDGVATVVVGSGFVPGTEFSVPAGGLTREIFLAAPEARLEIAVTGQITLLESASFATQPFAFVSDFAFGVADGAVTGETIRDGSVTAADLETSFLESLLAERFVDASGEIVTAESVPVSADIGLNNSGATTVSGVLQDLDRAIEALRDIDLAQSLDAEREDVAENYVSRDGTSPMTGDFDLGGFGIVGAGEIDGVDVSELADGTASHIGAAGGVHGLAGDLVGTDDSQSLANKTLDDSNVVSGAAIRSGTVGEAYLDDAMARDAELNFANFSGTADDAQIPSGIARDSELTFANLSGGASDAQIPSTIARDSELAFANLSGTADDAQIPSGIARDAELVFSNLSGGLSDAQIPSTIARDSELSFANLGGTASDAQIPSDVARDAEVSAAIEDRVGDLGASDIPAAIRPLAYGTASISLSGTTCTGYNVTGGSGSSAAAGGCQFLTGDGTSDYTVVATQSGTPSCSAPRMLFVRVASKTASAFSFEVYCADGNQPASGTVTLDFTVFSNP